MKVQLNPTTCLAPVPAVMVTCGDEEEANIITIAWTGTVNSDPPTVSVSVRYSRHSFLLLEKTGEFTINFLTEDLVRAADFCGCVSGKNIDKFEAASLTKRAGEKVSCPSIEESPVSLECRVVKRVDLKTHAVFFGEVVNVVADEKYTENGKLSLPDGLLIAYNNGRYLKTGKTVGTYGFTARED